MPMESTSARCEQLARQLLVFGRPIPPEEVTAKIEEVDHRRIIDVANQLLESRPTLSAVGPIGLIPSFEAIETVFA